MGKKEDLMKNDINREEDELYEDDGCTSSYSQKGQALQLKILEAAYRKDNAETEMTKLNVDSMKESIKDYEQERLRRAIEVSCTALSKIPEKDHYVLSEIFREIIKAAGLKLLKSL